MKPLSLQDKVEEFLSSADYLALGINGDNQILLVFDNKNLHPFDNAENLANLIAYWTGKHLKLVVTFNSAPLSKDYISLVDIDSGYAVNLDGPKFIRSNFNEFLQLNIANNTVFAFNIVARNPAKNKLLLSVALCQNDFKIYGYYIGSKNDLGELSINNVFN